MRGTFTELTKTLSRNYDGYRQQIVRPLFSRLARCDRLIIVVDIPYLLAAGGGALEDQEHLIKKVLEALVPKRGPDVRDRPLCS